MLYCNRDLLLYFTKSGLASPNRDKLYQDEPYCTVLVLVIPYTGYKGPPTSQNRSVIVNYYYTDLFIPQSGTDAFGGQRRILSCGDASMTSDRPYPRDNFLPYGLLAALAKTIVLINS
jgi:hypothetical protein